MFKFKIGQEVYCILENRLHSAKILSRQFTENSEFGNKNACTQAQKETYQAFGPDEIKYSTIHGIFSEAELFATKEDLVKHLIGD